MLNQLAEPETRYGGPWTLKKLDILETYLDRQGPGHMNSLSLIRNRTNAPDIEET